MAKYPKQQSGFTIVELIIAMVVGSIFASITSLIVVNQSRISQHGRDLTLANSFAEVKIEGLRSAGFNNLTAGTSDITSELPSELKAPRSSVLSILDISPGVRQIDLSITYSDQGTPRTFEYRTYVGELGVGQY